MWKAVFKEIILFRLEEISPGLHIKEDKEAFISEYVSDILKNLPWFYFIPISFLAQIVSLFSIFIFFKPFPKISTERKRFLLKKAKFIPLWGLLNKLVTVLTYLRMFDIDCSEKNGLLESKVKI